MVLSTYITDRTGLEDTFPSQDIGGKLEGKGAESGENMWWLQLLESEKNYSIFGKILMVNTHERNKGKLMSWVLRVLVSAMVKFH